MLDSKISQHSQFEYVPQHMLDTKKSQHDSTLSVPKH